MDCDTKPEALSTHGVRKNGKQVFNVAMKGEEVYRLLQMLEREAVGSQNYLDVRAAVYFAELVRDQVREQGF